MPAYVVQCVPGGDQYGAPVAPCTAVEGIAYRPEMVASAELGGISYESSGQLYSWALGLVLTCLVLGFVIGSIIRVVRSA